MLGPGAVGAFGLLWPATRTSVYLRLFRRVGRLRCLLSSHRLPASWLLRQWVGFCPLPSTPVRPPLVLPGPLWALLGFFPSWAPRQLRGCRRPEATQLPRPLCGATHPPRVFLPLRRLCTPPPLPHSVGLVVHSGGLASPIVSPHSRGYASCILLPASVFPPCPGLAPWRTHVPASSVAAEWDLLTLLPPAHAPTCSHPTPLYCVTHGDAISVSQLPHGSPSIIPSSFVSSDKPPSLPPLHPSLASSLSPWTYPRRSPLSLLRITYASWTSPMRSSSAVILPCAVVLLPVSASPCGRLKASPFRLPSPTLLPPSSLRALAAA